MQGCNRRELLVKEYVKRTGPDGQIFLEYVYTPFVGPQAGKAQLIPSQPPQHRHLVMQVPGACFARGQSEVWESKRAVDEQQKVSTSVGVHKRGDGRQAVIKVKDEGQVCDNLVAADRIGHRVGNRGVPGLVHHVRRIHAHVQPGDVLAGVYATLEAARAEENF